MPFINDLLAENRTHTREAGSPVAADQPSALQSRFSFDPQAITDLLKQRLAGQREIIEALGEQLRIVKADLCEPGRPLYVTLFIGDTGVGKTEIVRLLAQAIHGTTDSFCRLDMNTLSQSHYSAAVTGAPPGYVGSKEGTTLFNEDLIKGSFDRPGIVLFDEIEKASNDVARALMNVLDTGKLKLASGNRELDFSNCLIFMTSNVGSKAWMQVQRRAKGRWHQRLINLMRTQPRSRTALIEDALHERFDPEFINRIDRVELFEPLSSDHLETIVQLELERTNLRLKRKGIEVQLTHSAIDLLCEQGFDAEFGARAIRRSFRQRVMLPLADCLLNLPASLPATPSTPPLTLIRGHAAEGQILFKRVPDEPASHTLPKDRSPQGTAQEM